MYNGQPVDPLACHCHQIQTTQDSDGIRWVNRPGAVVGRQGLQQCMVYPSSARTHLQAFSPISRSDLTNITKTKTKTKNMIHPHLCERIQKSLEYHYQIFLGDGHHMLVYCPFHYKYHKNLFSLSNSRCVDPVFQSHI